MAILNIFSENRKLTDADDISRFLVAQGLTYEWLPLPEFPLNATPDMILAGCSLEIERLKRAGSYIACDVIDVNSQTPGLDSMLGKFSLEHWHDEDEVRLIVSGKGIFHIHPKEGNVFSVEVSEGDMITVPRGTLHWFNLCADRRIRAIRLFQDPSGWAPHYTESGVDEGFAPLCFGSPAGQINRHINRML